MTPYVKTILRSIRMTLPRVLAIFAIIALGVGFFSGLKVTTPSFVYTADVYTKEYAMFDFKFLSTIGFEQEDIDEIAKRTNCIVEGSYTADCAAYLGDSVGADTVRFCRSSASGLFWSMNWHNSDDAKKLLSAYFTGAASR